MSAKQFFSLWLILFAVPMTDAITPNLYLKNFAVI
jgi:hypothetical protein